MRIAARGMSALGLPARAPILRCRMEPCAARNRAAVAGPAVLLVSFAAPDARAAVGSINRAGVMRSVAATTVRAFACSDRSPFPREVRGLCEPRQRRRTDRPDCERTDRGASMHATHFDRCVQEMTTSGTRRGLLRLLAILPVPGALAAFPTLERASAPRRRGTP